MFRVSDIGVECKDDADSNSGGISTAMTLLVIAVNNLEKLLLMRMIRTTKPHRQRNTANR